MPEPWGSVQEVATHLGVAKDSVYRWIDSKCLPAHQIGRLWKFKVSEVGVWVRSRGTMVDDGDTNSDSDRVNEGRSNAI